MQFIRQVHWQLFLQYQSLFSKLDCFQRRWKRFENNRRSLCNFSFDSFERYLITHFQLEFELYYGYLSNWRQIIKLPKFEFCSLTKTASKYQGAEAIVASFLNKTEGSNLSCPLKKATIFKITNYTESAKGIMGLPSGNYRVEFLVSNKFDEMIFQFKLKYSIKTAGTDKYEF